MTRRRAFARRLNLRRGDNIMLIKRTGLALAAAAAAFIVASAISASAQQAGPPVQGAGEVSNFGGVPFSNPQIIITRNEDRVTWRKLEDKHLKERRDLEDKYDAELRAMRRRQADERDAALKSFAQ
jgi:hypothetical protein